MERASLICHFLDLFMKILDDLRFLQFRRSRIEKPCLSVMRITYLKEWRFLHEVDLKSVLIARRKCVSLDLIVQ